jgi:hypothetical protein
MWDYGEGNSTLHGMSLHIALDQRSSSSAVKYIAVVSEMQRN